MNTMQTRSVVTRKSSPGQHAISLERNGITEWFVTSLALPHEDPQGMSDRLESCLAECASPTKIQTDIVGEVNTAGTTLWQQKYCYDCSNCKLNHFRGASHECPVGGMFVHAMSGVPLEPVWLGGEVIGFYYEDDYARYLQINNLYPDPIGSRKTQLRQLFTRIEAALHTQGMKPTDIIRAWFYLEDILDWYDTFNELRDEWFVLHGIFNGLVPVSTGIGASNPNASAAVADILAVIPKNDNMRITPLPSPLQCPALDYGSSFSRALEMVTPDHRRILVSGTASIHPGGETAFVEDIDGQVDLTMRVIAAILQSRDMDWADVVRGIAYVKRKEDFSAFERYCRANNLPPLPVPIVRNDVCRDDLLFELEVDAIQ